MIACAAAGFILILICGIYYVNMMNSRRPGIGWRILYGLGEMSSRPAALSKVINQARFGIG